MNTTASAKPIFLASTSPFRRELLERLGIAFETVAPGVDETRLQNETADELVRRLSLAKAHEGVGNTPGVVEAAKKALELKPGLRTAEMLLRRYDRGSP